MFGDWSNNDAFFFNTIHLHVHRSIFHEYYPNMYLFVNTIQICIFSWILSKYVSFREYYPNMYLFMNTIQICIFPWILSKNTSLREYSPTTKIINLNKISIIITTKTNPDEIRPFDESIQTNFMILMHCKPTTRRG